MAPTLNEKKIFETISQAKRILLLTDERIDGDTTGSTLAMFHFLKILGKEVIVFSPKHWSHEYHFLPGYSEVDFDPDVLVGPFDLAMIFDCADGAYLSQLPFSKFRYQSDNTSNHLPPLIVFDHHATNPHYGTINHVLVNASSTGEVVWQFFKVNRLAINKDIATCLMTAICTDTTLFTNPSTNQVCMEAAAELGLAGARVQDVVRSVYMNKSVGLLKVWGLVLERLQELPGGIVVSYLFNKDREVIGENNIDTSAISNFLIGMVANARVIAILAERPDGSVKGNLRTLDGDVSVIAKRFGGGGHIKAAGFSIANARLEESPHGWRVVRSDGAFLPVGEMLKS